ncbi:UDP-N-acetylglucosamine 2-epimerase [Pseudoalteromonas shioyasakiensis]|uniref:UDP-N-acetylglucosamine 2-epimerase n=1 Tax=Pseudoalteromonas shioyasakiensis TaxID=1190813 RepID=UPI002118ECFE|nr:UDP-N-acetylglucosamine 2-epimerase [Pseudoalteromonas shioyasakiensis]MCQ8877374.1 UDP-N-acetylglucosamine 2-epimerase [Pseudoalteromonas shioyasakiensis]
MRKIGVVTGTRADFGLLNRVILLLQKQPAIKTVVFACGTHLSPEYGYTINELTENGIENIIPIEMLLSSTTRVGIAKSTGLATISFADVFNNQQLDCLLILGDRFEIFAAAQAALFLGIPIAHIHGGEITEGAFDEALRHSISKMASIHFPATDSFAKRLMQLGEQPSQIFVTGAPGVDNIQHTEYVNDVELSTVLTFKNLKLPLFLVTYHPVTNGHVDENDISSLLELIIERHDINFLVSYPNADGEGAAMIRQWLELSHLEHVTICPSLGFKRYLAVMKQAACVIGNSSSGLIEAPSFKIPTINIGTRQKGRPKSCSVIDTVMDKSCLIQAVNQALNHDFILQCQQAVNPYGEGNASEKIVKILSEIDLSNYQLKPFYDIEMI